MTKDFTVTVQVQTNTEGRVDAQWIVDTLATALQQADPRRLNRNVIPVIRVSAQGAAIEVNVP